MQIAVALNIPVTALALVANTLAPPLSNLLWLEQGKPTDLVDFSPRPTQQAKVIFNLQLLLSIFHTKKHLFRKRNYEKTKYHYISVRSSQSLGQSYKQMSFWIRNAFIIFIILIKFFTVLSTNNFSKEPYEVAARLKFCQLYLWKCSLWNRIKSTSIVQVQQIITNNM